MDYNEIIGHDKIIHHLKNTVKNNTISNSYLFSGPKSIGKKEIALAFAKTLLCKKEGIEPCNTCLSCIKFNSGNNPDIYIEKPEDNYFKKEQIDSIQKQIITLPYECKRKVFILQDVDKMTKSAQNSFLKTLEESPEHVVIIMICVNHNSILPTIVSRCQVVKFTPVETTIIQSEILDKYDITNDRAHFVASFSGGIVGKAIKLCTSDEFNDLRDNLIVLIDRITNSDMYKIFTESKFFVENKDSIDDIMDMILVWFRDLIIYKETNSTNLIINKDKIDIIKEQCMKLSSSKIHNIIEIVKDTKNKIKSKVNLQHSVEFMLMKIQEG